jgi:hypothetical protein
MNLCPTLLQDQLRYGDRVANAVSHRRGEYVRRAVLAAAWAELAEAGLARATVAGVARRSGVHETTIYRRWLTRENLLVDAMLTHSADVIPSPIPGPRARICSPSSGPSSHM